MVGRVLILLVLGFVTLPAIAAERFVQLGVNAHQADHFTGDVEIDNQNKRGAGYVIRVGARNAYGEQQQHWLGLGVDFQAIDDNFLLGFRAVDYQYQSSEHYRMGVFVGAAQLDSGAAQTGYYGGLNFSCLDLFEGMDAVVELQYGDGMARDRLVAGDPAGTLPDMFMDFVAVSFSVGWRF